MYDFAYSTYLIRIYGRLGLQATEHRPDIDACTFRVRFRTLQVHPVTTGPAGAAMRGGTATGARRACRELWNKLIFLLPSGCHSSSRCTTCLCPRRFAHCSGVRPRLSLTSNGAPARSKIPHIGAKPPIARGGEAATPVESAEVSPAIVSDTNHKALDSE